MDTNSPILFINSENVGLVYGLRETLPGISLFLIKPPGFNDIGMDYA